MKNKKSSNSEPEFNKIYKIISLIIGILLTISLVRNALIISKATERIEKSKRELEEIKNKNTELKEQYELVNTEEYLERQARGRLGLVKEEETILVLPEEDVLRKLAPQIEEETEDLPDPNWKKWLKLFI